MVLLVVAAYLAANLYAARATYGRWRARKIDERAEEEARVLKRDPVKVFNQIDRTEYIVGSFVAAVFWPITLLCLGIARFVTHDPPQSRTELETERDRMADRIRELEAELGLSAGG